MCKYSVIILALVWPPIVTGQLILEGQCDEDWNIEPDLDLEQFEGVWYEISRIPNSYQSGDCVVYDFKHDADDDDVLLVNITASNDNFFEYSVGTLEPAYNRSARFTLSLYDLPEDVDYFIAMVEYEIFALAFSCQNIDSTEMALTIWKVSRFPQYPNENILALLDTTIFNIFAVNASETMIDIDHSEYACYILPEIGDGDAVVVPGQCEDTGISAVQNFDLSLFAGLWHDIAHYQTEGSVNTCPQITYIHNDDDGTITIEKTFVVDQSLLVEVDNTTLAATDGSGKLKINLLVDDDIIETELWIIATDYTNYALTYSCHNVNANEMRVWSTKLSRTRQLSPTSAQAIEEIIDSYLVLNDRYYAPSDQSDDTCFYYPDHVENQPVVFRGTCDMNIPAYPNFDVERYSGLWHEIESYPSLFQLGTCNNARYTLGTEGTVDVYNTQVIGEVLYDIHGTASLASEDGSAKLIVTFPVAGTDVTVSSSYWVLDTDYDSYALVYTCGNLESERRAVWSWKLSRRKELNNDDNNAMNSIINGIPVLDERYYQVRDQSTEGCFFYPEPVLGKPVVFPGQCDESIAVVADFDIERFQNTWHEISAYPEEADGQCVNSNFAAIEGIDGNYEVTRTRVVDYFLETLSATASFSSTDGSAKFTIDINVDGTVTTVPYWILTTDYDNYALAYTCMNNDDDWRSVWSWKLSRTRSGLSPDANGAIDEIISAIQILSDDYYEDTNQSDDACFFLPDIPPGEPVIINGQCDLNIPVVSNFDPVRYAGLWRSIESYPSEFEFGTCNEANYTLDSENNVIVYNTQVFNEGLMSITGTAVMESTDGSGKLIVTFPDEDGTGTVTATYWILSTDYNSYSFVYSCVNLDPQTHRVYSWKLSRERELAETSSQVIDEVIRSIRVLHERYYLDRIHSDEACFYYPEHVQGQPVTFRGQCDENIRVVQDFDVQKYMGLWFDVESYPQAFQQGTCATAVYTLNDNIVNVVNQQVVAQELDSITGSAILASEDGSAKLIVSFPIPGTDEVTSSNYWVLDTDYDNYAFVYSCHNINVDRRSVSTWKLSRRKELNTDENNAMNSIIDGIPVLDERYFEVRDHSPEGCFFYPEPVLGKPVVFPGQCDESIAAVADFDIERFQNTWHEISAYPEEADGQCVNSNFAAIEGIDGNYEVTRTRVVDYFLETLSATASFSSTDGSAKFTIDINVDGTVTTVPYWILTTDYDNYALAYTCMNNDDDWRSVWSWKLSRTRSGLSPDANGAIDEIISAIQVLSDDYYEDTNQSDDACFFLPDIPPGEPVIINGQCDLNIPVVSNFDPVRYAGLWRSIESYPSEFEFGTCNEANYTLDSENNVIVFNTQVFNEGLMSITGTAVMESTDGSGKLIVTFPDEDGTGTVTSTYWILSTDYNSYSLVYSCVNLDPQTHRVYSWKLSRERELTETSSQAIDEVIRSIRVLHERYYLDRIHSDEACFYYPEHVQGQPVTFRGQCDENIRVVQDFDVQKYMGLWFDVESYPQAFQQGTCATAVYTLNDNIVNVVNQQVVAQELDSITGSAILASEDGSAKLIVSFPIPGTDEVTSSNYWVLDTDYDNYALVYSCHNINVDRRSVSTWKLSRRKELNTDENNAMNSIIDGIPVLDERYFEVRDHSPEGCFFYPEPVLGKPVVFPGQCDESIAAVADFDIERFQNTWHEISAYPEEADGQCVNSNFAAIEGIDGNYEVTRTRVVDYFLETLSATASFSSTDGSAKFTIDINVDGTVTTVPYWILTTDYDNYALAYTCMNNDDDWRSVWSWKLSRTRSGLSPDANGAIDEIISEIQVLSDDYYEDTNQSDDACFFLPDIPPGEPVIINGQCDLNIPVVSNFDPVRYAGLWRSIESYPSEFEFGTCNEANYTLDSENNVIVYNTQVFNEGLMSITGTAVMESTDGSGKLIVTFPDEDGTGTVTSTYWILSTDYNSYSLVYSCVNLDPQTHRVYSWKLSRERQLTETSSQAIDEVIRSIRVLHERYYLDRIHSDEACFYYPEHVQGQPVTFRGQCDENIRVVQDFDVQKYMGLWFDVESYPQAFQQGTCATAVYTLNDNIVNVVNQQVVAQELDSITGSAILASEDGSAKLIVSFPIPGTDEVTSSNYWVLDTDYDNYALVYSCHNIDVDRRSVSTWKLSRESFLDEASSIAIDNVMNEVQVLDERYYEERGHSDDDCFYYPENFGGPVILEGQCEADNEVDVVIDFQPSEFAGLWREIARFPAEFQTGECAQGYYEYDATTNRLSMTHTIIYEERITSVTGVAEIPSDNRGILTATFPNDNGGNDVITYYVLRTDYNEFALLYSCTPRNNTHKQVYSWKLGRRTELSDDANAIIDSAVTDTVPLFERYYEYSDQSAEACFHYPTFNNPSSIILPGVCDESIRAMPDFDFFAYLGQWYEVARYPQPLQVGDCTRVHYVLGLEGIYIMNIDVIDEQLNTVVGTTNFSPDGSGLLEVTVTVDGVETVVNYYVLETDYINFSLVYSCINLDGGNRLVSSWKLSRHREYDTQYDAVMNPIIENTQGLLEEYYMYADQSDDACFYVPTLNENEPVRFRGRCDENVKGMENFNMQDFLGWWHEIEHYPSGYVVGDCLSSLYETIGNQYFAVNTSIVGLDAVVTTNSLQLSSEAPGRLRKMMSDGQTIDVWVLDTDYTSYALLYYCQDLDLEEEYRQVWSAKLSKTRVLTAAAQTALNTAIEENRLLYDHLYLDVDQSDPACFHYPVQTTNEIVLPGQCDQDILVVQNFDLASYTGTWYEIQKYREPRVSGSCVGSRYRLNEETNVLEVLDWEVVDEELVTAEGTAVLAPDNSGRLTFTVPELGSEEPVTKQLYVLATDYASYSLLYSCRNRNEFQRVVGSWILSRTRSLHDSAVSLINAVMSQRQELHQPYFITTEQDEECPNSAFSIQISVLIIIISSILTLVLA